MRRSSSTKRVSQRDGRLTSSDIVMDCAKIGLVVKRKRRSEEGERVCAADKRKKQWSAGRMWRGEIEKVGGEGAGKRTEGGEKVRYLNFFFACVIGPGGKWCLGAGGTRFTAV